MDLCAPRAFVSWLLGLSLLVMVLTGVVLSTGIHIAGSSADWFVFGMDAGRWKSVQREAGMVVVFLAVIHVFVVKRPGRLSSLLAATVVFGGTALLLPPIPSLVQHGSRIECTSRQTSRPGTQGIGNTSGDAVRQCDSGRCDSATGGRCDGATVRQCDGLGAGGTPNESRITKNDSPINDSANREIPLRGPCDSVRYPSPLIPGSV